MQTIQNEILTVSISELGAELQSIRKGDQEYLWQGDPAFWGRRSPILFPIVGSVWEGRYRIAGKEFQMGQHGFARDLDFKVIELNKAQVKYQVASNEETLKVYPYKFILEISYRVHDNNIDVIWEVTNPSDEKIFFQIGAHPAFYYPDFNPETKERGFLSFEPKRNLLCTKLKEKGCIDPVGKNLLEIPENGLLPIDRETFDPIDTIVTEDSQMQKVTLHKNDGTPWLSMEFDAPVVGIWSPPHKNAPFICLEPWYGRCDKAGFEGEFKEKDWVNALEPGQKFKTQYTIEIL